MAAVILPENGRDESICVRLFRCAFFFSSSSFYWVDKSEGGISVGWAKRLGAFLQPVREFNSGSVLHNISEANAASEAAYNFCHLTLYAQCADGIRGRATSCLRVLGRFYVWKSLGEKKVKTICIWHTCSCRNVTELNERSEKNA